MEGPPLFKNLEMVNTIKTIPNADFLVLTEVKVIEVSGTGPHFAEHCIVHLANNLINYGKTGNLRVNANKHES